MGFCLCGWLVVFAAKAARKSPFYGHKAGLFKYPEDIPFQAGLEDFERVLGHIVDGRTVLCKLGTMGGTLKNPPLAAHKADFLGLLVAADLTGRHKLTLQVPGNDHKITADKISGGLQGNTVRSA